MDSREVKPERYSVATNTHCNSHRVQKNENSGGSSFLNMTPVITPCL